MLNPKNRPSPVNNPALLISKVSISNPAKHPISLCIRLCGWFLNYCYSATLQFGDATNTTLITHHHSIRKNIIQLVPLTVTSPFTKTHILKIQRNWLQFFWEVQNFHHPKFPPGSVARVHPWTQIHGIWNFSGQRFWWAPSVNVATRRSRWDPWHPLRCLLVISCVFFI